MDFKETIQKIKNEYNIIDYIRMNGVDLKEGTNGSWVGLCPFHNEKTPSFTVSEDFQNYRCFGCGESGDLLSFTQQSHTVSFFEAMKMLAEEKGIEIKDNLSNESSHDINGIRQVVLEAQKFFKSNYEKLDETHPAKQEVIKRKLNVNNPIYGYSLEAPNELYKHLRKKGHSDKNIKDSNLVMFFEEENRQPWDFFHGRLMITLSDYLGRPISFTSRKIYEDDKMKGKYVNGKESPVFLKKSVLFGADTAKKNARDKKLIYVVEGQFDEIAMTENEVTNVVATSGTAFTDEHANLLLRMVGDTGKIVFIMDGDDAGVEAAIKVFTSSKTLHANAYAVHLENKKDPCDYIIDGGIGHLQKFVEEKTVPLHDFVIEATLKKLGGSIDMNNRQNFVTEIARYAKSTNESYIVDSMLNKASILSAISITNVKEIYNKTQANQKPARKVEEKKTEELRPMIKLNTSSQGDSCMFTALSLLVRLPDELIDKTPKQIHKKFRPFMKELGQRYSNYKRKDGRWRFIAEDYEDSDFAKALQNKPFLVDPKDDIESSMSQYEYLFNRANEVYKRDHEEMKRAKALSSIVDSTDPQEIASALRLYKKSQVK